MKLSPWIIIDGYCATRVLEGTDPNNAENRVAFIEKTPRVKAPRNFIAIETHNEAGAVSIKKNQSAWIYGHGEDIEVYFPQYRNNILDCAEQTNGTKYCSGEYGFDPKCRTWCDSMLLLFGYELP